MARHLPGRDSRGLPHPRVRRLVDRVPFLDKELFALRDLVPRGGTVVDVGAAGGAHTFVAADLVGPYGRVVAVEARAGSAGLLRAWRRVLGAAHVTIVHAALGAEAGELTLRVPLVPTRSHRDGGDDGTLLARLPATTRSVGMTTLDHLATSQQIDRLDLLKVDVEGAEAAVLDGGHQVLERYRPVLVLEVFDPFLRREGTSARELFDRVVDYGYQPHRFGDHGLVPTTHDPDEHNYVFLPA